MRHSFCHQNVTGACFTQRKAFAGVDLIMPRRFAAIVFVCLAWLILGLVRCNAAPVIVSTNGGMLEVRAADILLGLSGEGIQINGQTVRLNVNAAFGGFGGIVLQADDDVVIDAATILDLNNATGVSAAGSLLRMEAGRNLILGDNAQIVSAGGWSVRGAAGVDFNSPDLSIQSGAGGIYLNGGPTLNGSGAIEVADGSINLEAGHEILLGGGFVRSSAGGSINIKTGDGDANAGTRSFGFNNSGFNYSSSGEVIVPIGGIGTMAGGEVKIDAGQDIISLGPVVGAFGRQPGDVTLHAGRRVLGSYGLRNGHGLITAGVTLQNDNNLIEGEGISSSGADIGSPSSPISLSLVSGSWRGFAGEHIWLTKVFSPNVSLNQNRMTTGARVRFQFDYGSDASASLAAGSSVNLVGANPIHRLVNADRVAIYSPGV